MFMKKCVICEECPDGSWKTISEGDLQVYYDPELYAARISANDESGTVFSNTLIGVNTEMQVSTEKSCFILDRHRSTIMTSIFLCVYTGCYLMLCHYFED